MSAMCQKRKCPASFDDLASSLPHELVNDIKFDFRGSPFDYSKRIGGRIRDVDRSSSNERASIVDPNHYGAPIGYVGHAQPRAKWQCKAGSGQFVRIELFAARGL